MLILKPAGILVPRGQRGEVVTLNYLTALQVSSGKLRFQRKALQ